MESRFAPEMLSDFQQYLEQEEKSRATIEKYLRDVRLFYHNLPDDKVLSKERVLAFKEYLVSNYQAVSVNSMLAAVNRFLIFIDCRDLQVKRLRIQRQLFRNEDRELEIKDYQKLLKAAAGQQDERLYLVMLTICSTGIRVSELPYITRAAVSAGKAEVNCKNKTRVILIPSVLRKLLLAYAEKQKIMSGHIFITRSGRPLDRGNIWTSMKKLCESAGVEKKKVFPHNLRHLFARTYYRQEKDIVKLADILGHASVETARIYTCSASGEHMNAINRLALIPEAAGEENCQHRYRNDFR